MARDVVAEHQRAEALLATVRVELAAKDAALRNALQEIADLKIGREVRQEQMASIVKLLPGSKSLITLTDSMASIKLVRSEIFRSKRTYVDIAKGAGVAKSTVGNIASEKTHWPRLETIIRVLGSLGWVITAQRRD